MSKFTVVDTGVTTADLHPFGGPTIPAGSPVIYGSGYSVNPNEDGSIPTPCPYCGRETDAGDPKPGTWFDPCPSDDCPSNESGWPSSHPSSRLSRLESD